MITTDTHAKNINFNQDISATHRAYKELRRMILIGEYRPGERLKIETLRLKLKTGASPIREALSLLTSDQLVERLDQRGFRAANASRENFEEILKLRCALEDMALRESIENASESWEENIVLCHHRMERCSRDDIEKFEELHKIFHMALLAGCDSPILLRYCSQLYDLNVRYRYLALQSKNYLRRDITKEHQNIMDSAIAKNADLASERLLNHYRQTGAYLTGLLDGAL
jgi:GntR family carbon starvation induced transcriptional regulator